MRYRHFILIAAVQTLAACSKRSVANGTAAPSQAGTQASAEQNVNWGPAPAVFPAGAEMAVMQGDPSKAESFTVRLRFPNGYRLQPHTHPTTENVTVLSGTFLAGMGGRFVESEMQAFDATAFASIPADHAHYAMARGTTVVQVQAQGPFALTYVNPADTPKAR